MLLASTHPLIVLSIPISTAEATELLPPRSASMLRVDGYAGNWALTAIAIPEIRFDLNPVLGSDFFPGTAVLARDEPDHWEDVELAGEVTGIFSGWDVSFHGAWFWNDQPRLDRGGISPRLIHDRLFMLGSGGNYTAGSWLFKYELAYLDGLGFFNADSDKSRIDGLLGIEYYGWIDTTVVLVAGIRRPRQSHQTRRSQA